MKRITHGDITSGKAISNAPFRALVERCIETEEISGVQELAELVGVTRPRYSKKRSCKGIVIGTRGDSTTLGRALGMQCNNDDNGDLPQWIRRELAANIVRALHRYPVDYGL